MKSFKQYNEDQEINELFGSLPFKIDIGAISTKGKGEWKFDYKVPVRDAAISFIDDGVFKFVGPYKDALKALHKYLKNIDNGNLKQAKVKLVK